MKPVEAKLIRVLIVNDDVDETRALTRFLRHDETVGVLSIEAVHSIESAKRWLGANPTSLLILIVDMLLPALDTDGEAMKKLDEQRSRLIDKYMTMSDEEKTGKSNAARDRLGEEIAIIEGRLHMHFDHDGGLKVMEFAQDWLKSHAVGLIDGLRVVVWSARSKGSIRADFNELIPGSHIRFATKPILLGEIVSSVRDLLLTCPISLDNPPS
jgi:hypothetical protein